MRKCLLFCAAVLILSACQTSDFDTIKNIVSRTSDDDYVFCCASRGGEIVRVPISDKLLEIYNNGEKDSVFVPLWDETRDLVISGTCLINIYSETEYRVFCGEPADIKTGNFWAVSVNPPSGQE